MARIVRISDMTDEEKENWQQQVQERHEKFMEERNKEQERVTKLFNKLPKASESNGSTTVGSLLKAYKGSSNYNTLKKSIESNILNKKKENGSIGKIDVKEKQKSNIQKINMDINRPTVNIPEALTNESSLTLPKARIATNDEVRNARMITGNEIKARLEAQKINEEIEKGGYRKVNAIISNTLSSFEGGVKKGVAGIANAFLIPVAGQLQHYSNVGKSLGVFNKERDNILDKAYNKILDSSDDISETASYREKINSNIKNSGAQVAGNVSNTIGNMIPSIASNIIAHGSGLIVTGVSSGGNSAHETINEDRDNLGQAIATGVIKGGIEAGTEKITGGNFLSKGSLDDVAGKVISSKVKSNVGKWVANKAYQFGGEMLEEQISDNAGYVVDKIINNKDLPEFEEWWNNAGETNKMTFLTTLALNMFGLGGGNIVDDYETKAMVDKVTEAAKNNPEIQQQVQTTVNNINGINNNNSTIKNVQEIAQSTRDMNALTESELPTGMYQYAKSDNVKIDTWRKDASQNFVNSNEAIQFSNVVEKLIEQKGYNVRLDTNLTDSNGNVADGRITTLENGEVEITLNPKSNRAGEFLITHEITHAIETQQMKDYVNKYASKHADFAESLKALQETYGTKEVSSEVLADVSAQLFGNQEFINDLVAENTPQSRSFIQKVYEGIQKIKNMFTKEGRYKNFVNNLESMWRDAYNTQYNNLENDTKFAKENDEIFGNYWNVETGKDIFKNVKNKPKEAYSYLLNGNKNFETIVDTIDGKEVKFARISAKEYVYGRNSQNLQNNEYNQKMRMAPSIDDLIENANVTYHSPLTHKNDMFKEGYNNYQGKVGIDNNIFQYIIRVGKAKNDNIFYDISLELLGQKNRTRVKVLGANNNTSLINNSNSINSITPKTNNVNTTKYSIQEGKNNTQENSNKSSFSMQESGKWQEYLDNHYKQTGTRTNMTDMLPKAEKKSAPTAKETIAKKTSSGTEEKKIAEILTENPKKVKEKSRAWAIMKANILDKGLVFEKLSQKVDKLARKNGKQQTARELQGKWDYTLSASARAQNAIGNTRYEYDSKTKTQKQISKSLEDIKLEVGDNKTDFYRYMYNLLNIDRMTLEERYGGDTGLNYERPYQIKNKPVFSNETTADISREIVADLENKYPKFKEWAQDVYDYNNANKIELVKNGVISQELSDKLEDMYPHYVPIQRIDHRGNAINVPLDTGRTGVNTPLKRAKGGTSDIMPLFETMADRTMQTYRSSARNNFGVELKAVLQQLGEYQETEINHANIDTILDDMGNEESVKELLQENKNGIPTFTVFENGKKVTYEITRDMYDALKPMSETLRNINNSKFSKVANKISNFRRAVLTEYNPLFALYRNPVKDMQDVLANSEHAVKTYSKFPEAYIQMAKKGYWYKEYVANGGMQNSYFKDGEFESSKKPTKVGKLRKAVTMPLNAISKVNNIIEMAPRLAEYIASREAGRSIETSMLDASRVTTNFKAGGDWTKTLNRNGATFLNASIQGFNQNIRNIRQANVKGLKGWTVLASKTIAMGIPALILNNICWRDDEDYEELQDYVKDKYYIVAKTGEGNFIRIPKGRIVSVVQKLVTTVEKYVDKKQNLDIDNFSRDFWENIKFAYDNLAPNNPLDNNILSPIIQVITNKSWYGEDIVPSRLQKKPVAEQYDEKTDKLSIWLGEKLNVSPYKINYLLDQYGGGLSDVLLPTMTKQAENNVFEDEFTTNNVSKSKYPGEFFEKLDELEIKSNSDNATDEDILKYKYASEISKEMSSLYEQKREIQNSDKEDAKKKEEIKEVQRQINSLAKNALTDSDKVNATNNTATVQQQGYYKKVDLKTGETSWNTLSDEEINKNKNIPIKTYADYKEKVANETIKQRNNKTIKEDGQLKDKDKINIIINSNYTAKEKQAIYENYIMDEKDKKYPIIKESFTDKGLDITKYLKYKTQEFEADKEDDGTVKGKPISGTEKKKVYDYISNIKGATYTQKILLYALEYKPSSISDRNLVVNYVNSLPNKTGKERLDLLSNFAGVKVYKDGSYKY